MKELLQSSVNVVPYSFRKWIKGVPGLAASQRWLLRRFLDGEPFVHTVNAGPAAGLKFEITLPEDKMVWTGTYEHEFTRAIVSQVKPGAVCYDIGGYRGFVSGAMGLAGAAKVVVFEPYPVNHKPLQRLCELNPALPIEIVKVALGDIDGTASLLVMPQFSMAKLMNSPFQHGAEFVDRMEVPIRRLDTMVQTNLIPAPDLMKVDVEGAEVEVLQGALEMLAKFTPQIFIEAHSSSLEGSCREILSNLGYLVRRLGSERVGDEQTRHLMAYPENAS